MVVVAALVGQVIACPPYPYLILLKPCVVPWRINFVDRVAASTPVQDLQGLKKVYIFFNLDQYASHHITLLG